MAKVNTQHVLQARNLNGCVDAMPTSLTTGIVDGIGYFEASNTKTTMLVADDFGGSLDLTGDSNMLAVAAAQEDGNATGAGGDQGHDLASASGALYVFQRKLV